MGNWTTIKAAAYFTIPWQKEEFKEIVNGCVVHGEHKSDYCPECGNKKISFGKTREVYEHASQLTIEEDVLYCPNNWNHPEIQLLMSNYSGLHNVEVDQNQLLSITPESIDSAIKEFKRIHQHDIEHIQSKYGVEIEVKFGIFYDYS